MKKNKIIKILLFAVFCSTFIFTGKADAATITVPADCSLADAIDSINAGSDQGSCLADVAPDAYGANDTINLEAGTQTLSTDLATISTDLSLSGVSSTSSIIDGAGLYKALKIEGSGIEVSFSNFTVQNTLDQSLNAYGGSGNVTMNINNVVSKDNVNTSTGGGLVMDSATTVIVNNSIFEANSAEFGGGGIFNAGGDLTITNSLLINNTVVSGGGGGIGSASGSVSLTNVTIVGNTGLLAAGVLLYLDSAMTITNSTIYGNIASSSPAGGGIQINTASGGSLTLLNNLVAANEDSAGASNCATDDSLTPVSNGGNLSDDASCTIFNHTSDLASTDPMVATTTAVDNGGPTPTIALLAGSPARDAGITSGAPSADQRGVSRPQGTGIDIGAYEANVLAAVTPDPSASAGGGVGVPNTGLNKNKSDSHPFIIGSTVLAASIIFAFIKRYFKTKTVL